MFDHVTIRVSDRARSEAMYESVLRVLGADDPYSDERYAEWNDFSLSQARDGRPATQRLHIGFSARSRHDVDEFWRVGLEAGFQDDGEPGPRPQYGSTYYGGFLRDADGNSVEAVVFDGVRRDGVVDHLWIRVRDVDASRAFYELISPYAGFRFVPRPGRAQFEGKSGSFSVLQGEPTQNLHMAFPADDDAVVDAFHRAAVEAGYVDNGVPGERPVYHPGYYGAYVLDPDRNNVEVVNHNR